MDHPEDKAAAGRKKTLSRRHFLVGAGIGAGLAIFANGVLREPRAVRVEEIRLPLAKVPPGREIRIVHLSDLHMRAFSGYYRKVARMVMDLEPEVILLTGDYLEKERNLGGVRGFLENLRAPGGIFAVQGNWEYWARIEGENLRRHFARWGATLLIDERADNEVQGVPVSLFGLDYPSPADALQDLQRQADPGRLNLLLSHVPAFSHKYLNGRFDLLLAGHTHGGQVRLPFISPFYLPRFSGDYVAGLYHVGPSKTPLYVTRGVGTSMLPVRFLCPPEITLLRLVPSSS